jgi:hypothetical protein
MARRRCYFRRSFSFGVKIWAFLGIAALLAVGTESARAVTLAWDRNPETDVAGYRIYYGQLNSPATMIDVGNVLTTSINNLLDGRTYYFYATAYNTSGLESDPSQQVQYTEPVENISVTVSWPTSPVPDVTGYRLYFGRPNNPPTVLNAGSNTSLTVTNTNPPQEFYFYVGTVNSAGQVLEFYQQVNSSGTNVFVPRLTAAGGGIFAGTDTATQGSWKGRYGRDGYNVIHGGARYDYFSVTAANYSSLTWQNPSTAAAALQHPANNTRLATAVYSTTYFDLNFNLGAGAPRQLALYCLDFDNRGRNQRIELLDTAGRTLATTSLANFQSGIYALWKVHGQFTLRVRNLGSSQAVVSGFFVDPSGTPPISGPAQFIGSDEQTGGSWKGFYGRDGRYIVGDSLANPAYGSLRITGSAQYLNWTSSTTDPAALERAGSSNRLAAALSTTAGLNVNFTFNDTAPHRISLYCLDWDYRDRVQQIDLIETSSGQILNRQTISNFFDGVFLTWEVMRNVTLNIRPISGPNAVMSGVFFDRAGEVATPAILPNGGIFSGSTTVTITTATTGASIYYTLDGSTPTTASRAYSGPFALTNSATLRAAAFKSGMAGSLVRSASFIRRDNARGVVRFVRSDTIRGGTWKGLLGTQGHTIATESPAIPAYATVAFNGANPWIWSSSTLDPSALQRPAGTDRRASTWFSAGAMDFIVDLTDGATHKVSLYCVDFDDGNRIQDIEFIDATTGTLLDSVELSSFGGGAWLEYDMKGRVLIRVTRVNGPNAVLSGIFFDPPTGAL